MPIIIPSGAFSEQADKAVERKLLEESRMREALAAAQKQLADAAKAKQEQEVMLRKVWCGNASLD